MRNNQHAQDGFPADEEDAWGEDLDDAEDTITCQYCQKEIYADSVQCPHCSNYISREDSRSSRYPTWIIVTTIVLLILFLYPYASMLLAIFIP